MEIENYDNCKISNISSFSDCEDTYTLESALWDYDFGNITFFNSLNIEEKHKNTNLDVQRESNRAFLSLINDRIDYISKLKDLPLHWISGEVGEVPNESVIEVSKSLLKFFESRIRTKMLDLIPKLVMGPLPRGGMCIEFHAEKDNAIYVTIHNDETIEIDLKHFGYFYSLDANRINIGNKVVSQYESITAD